MSQPSVLAEQQDKKNSDYTSAFLRLFSNPKWTKTIGTIKWLSRPLEKVLILTVKLLGLAARVTLTSKYCPSSGIMAGIKGFNEARSKLIKSSSWEGEGDDIYIGKERLNIILCFTFTRQQLNLYLQLFLDNSLLWCKTNILNVFSGQTNNCIPGLATLPLKGPVTFQIFQKLQILFYLFFFGKMCV